jgi:hypothetical protein
MLSMTVFLVFIYFQYKQNSENKAVVHRYYAAMAARQTFFGS